MPGLRVEADGVVRAWGATSTLRGDRFDLYRAMMGRRSPAQLARLDWGGEPPAAIEAVAVFAAPVDVVQ